MQWLKQAAEGGVPEAQEFLGVMYFMGEHLAQDIALARYWVEKSAAQEFAPAQVILGLLYLDGLNGVAHDPEQGVRLLGKAAAQDNADAQYFIGTMYRDGEYLARDKAQARQWLEKAAMQDHENAIRELNVL